MVTVNFDVWHARSGMRRIHWTADHNAAGRPAYAMCVDESGRVAMFVGQSIPGMLNYGRASVSRLSGMATIEYSLNLLARTALVTWYAPADDPLPFTSLAWATEALRQAGVTIDVDSLARLVMRHWPATWQHWRATSA